MADELERCALVGHMTDVPRSPLVEVGDDDTRTRSLEQSRKEPQAAGVSDWLLLAQKHASSRGLRKAADAGLL